jgi:uncharacterized damage-inducible protein DinB
MRETDSISLRELMEFTGWERNQWRERLSAHGDATLGTGVGAHGDGRFETVGDLVKHIFIAEKHHVDRLSNRPITDVSAIPGDSVQNLFAFGDRSRGDLAAFVAAEPADDWDAPREYEINGKMVSVTPRKFIAHILLHEVRHWAQVATILRLHGITGNVPDFLFSPVMARTIKRSEETVGEG